jgi:rSAM/selenodomain-associated transferase 2
MTGVISIIIPTFNEADRIVPLLEHLRASFPDEETILADCGSVDGTAEKASGIARVVVSEKGRAVQMNMGAREAAGDILWFLHADCWPNPRSAALIREALEDPAVVGGGFRWELNGDKWYYPLVTRLAHFKNRIKRNLFGDMGIFVRTSVFRDLGGYVEIPLCEEVEFNKRLKKAGRTVILDEPLPSSDRKLLEEGPMRAFIKNDIIKIAFALGVSPETLKKYY